MMRIYIGNVELAGYFMRLKEGFDRIGVRADLWYLVKNKHYPNKSNAIVRLCQHLFSFCKKYKRSIFFPLVIPLVVLLGLMRGIIFVYSLIVYDVFILNSHPFFNFGELRVLKFFKKKIIVVFTGTESRPTYLGGNLIQGKYFRNGIFDHDKCHKEAGKQVKLVRFIESNADYIINSPPTALFHSKPFIAWLYIGFPYTTPSSTSTRTSGFPMKVLHAPSNTVSKGTREIIDVCNRANAQGLPLKLIKLENVPNDKVLDTITQCDIVIDEMYSDIPLGGLGTEAAFAHRPVLNGGYYASEVVHDYPPGIIPPACFCPPEDVESELHRLMADPELRKSLADQVYRFVIEHWDSAVVAKKYLQMISDTVPSEWMYHPAEIRSIFGYGIHKEKLRVFLKEYTAKFGEDGLYLSDKPQLLQKFREFLQT